MKRNLIILIILSIGMILRAFQWQNYPFGFDQVQILTNATSISEGKMTLIGPRTGPAPLFTGPLIYYWTALWIKLIPLPYTIILSTLLIHLITGGVLYFLLSRYFPKLSLTGLLIWSTSAYLVQLDRIPWNPNLIFLATICVFIPLTHAIQIQKIHKMDSIFIALGIFLGYQAHFSGLFLFPLTLVGLYSIKHVAKKYYYYCITAQGLTLLPNLIFDFRHQWFHLRGVRALFEIVPIQLSYHERFYHDLMVSIETGGKFLSLNGSLLTKLIVGFGIIIWFLGLKKQSLVEKFWVISLLVSIPFIFGWYSGVKPDYYFALLFPIWIYMITQITVNQSQITKSFLLIMIGITNLTSAWDVVCEINPIGIDNQIDIARYVNSLHPSKIIYYMPHGTTAGLEYLIQTDPTSSKVLTIEYPKDNKTMFQYQNEFIGVIQ